MSQISLNQHCSLQTQRAPHTGYFCMNIFRYERHLPSEKETFIIQLSQYRSPSFQKASLLRLKEVWQYHMVMT